MTIEVKFSSYSKGDFEKVIKYYNNNKPSNYYDLEELNRCEGGFMIKKENYEKLYCDENEKIKQLRWNNKNLVKFKNYDSFSYDEEKLLYESFIYVFGKDNLNFI